MFKKFQKIICSKKFAEMILIVFLLLYFFSLATVFIKPLRTFILFVFLLLIHRYNIWLEEKKKTYVVKVLGTQSPYNTKGHNCPGFFICNEENKILLDCGSGSHKLLQYPSDLNNIFVIITHLHRDHYNDIYNLQYSSFVFHNQKRIEPPITICLPSSPETISEDIICEKNAYAKYCGIDESKNFNVGNIKISFCKVDHPVETYAVKLEKNGKKIVYTSDTSYSAKDRLVKFAKDAELLICESSLLKEHGFPEINSHLTAAQAAEIAKQANVKMLGLTHFWPEEDTKKYLKEAKSIFGNVIVLKEEQVINI